MKPENIILAAAGVTIVILLAVMLYMKYIYGIRLHKEEIKNKELKQNMQEEYDRKIEKIRSSISHSFRIPLAIISGYGDILLKNNIIKEEESQEYLKKICDNTQYLTIMINRSLMQIQEKSIEPVCELGLMNLAEEIKKTAENAEKLLFQNGIVLRIYCESEKIFIRGDKIQIKNILNNLFDNSAKYMKCSGCINIEVRNAGNKVLLFYADNGEGMKAEETVRIFDESYQGSNGEYGSGNGMYIIKKIIDAHNAEIQVISDYNEGMKIFILFPTYSDNL